MHPVSKCRCVMVRDASNLGARRLDQIRTIAVAFPEVNERVSHGAVCFFVQDKRPVCYLHDNHRGDGRISLWCPAAPGVPEELVAAEPQRFFKPPTSARGTFSDWLAVNLDTPDMSPVDWHEIAAIIEEAYRLVAPKHLVAELDRRR
jgi:hypothetical protein